MAQVLRDISISYGGETYTFTPSNRLLRKIDAGLSPNSIMGVVNTMQNENLPLYDIAFIVSEFIKAGGGNVSEDDVLAELYADLSENEGKGIGPLLEALAAAISPPGATAKNPQAPAATGAKRSKRAK